MKNERKEELKDEMKNRISLALKDPILQQGFEIICKENAELKEQLNKNPCVCNTEWHCNDCLEQLTNAKELLKDITSSYGSTEVSEAHRNTPPL